MVHLPEPFGDDHGEGAVHDLVDGPAEHAFGRLVPRQDPALGIGRDHSVGGRLGHRAEPLLRRLEGVVQQPSFEDLAELQADLLDEGGAVDAARPRG